MSLLGSGIALGGIVGLCYLVHRNKYHVALIHDSLETYDTITIDNYVTV